MLRVPAGIPESIVCRDQTRGAAYRDDPVRCRVVSARWFTAMNLARERVQQELPRLSLPALFYVGTADGIVNHQATERAFATLPEPEAKDQSLERFEGYYHELHNEPPAQSQPVLELVEEWFERRELAPEES